jgi:hypothetical protein
MNGDALWLVVALLAVIMIEICQEIWRGYEKRTWKRDNEALHMLVLMCGEYLPSRALIEQLSDAEARLVEAYCARLQLYAAGHPIRVPEQPELMKQWPNARLLKL